MQPGAGGRSCWGARGRGASEISAVRDLHYDFQVQIQQRFPECLLRARHHGKHSHELFYDRRSQNTELIGHHQTEEFGKGQKENHMFDHLPKSFLLASILAKQCVRHQEGL